MQELMLSIFFKKHKASQMSLKSGDFYIENGKYVFTAQYLLNRGKCCNNRCRHCPYIQRGENDKHTRIESNQQTGSDQRTDREN
jgi:hypothetical protein